MENARSAVDDVVLDRCLAEGPCLQQTPRIVVGGPGVSGSVFVDNAAFREYTFKTFGARVLDMESAAVAHVSYANGVPFIAVRSLGLAAVVTDRNQIESSWAAASNSAAVVKRCCGRCGINLGL